MIVLWTVFTEIGSASADSVSDVGRIEYWENQVQGLRFGRASDCSQSLEGLLCQSMEFLWYLLVIWLIFLYSSRLYVDVIDYDIEFGYIKNCANFC